MVKVSSKADKVCVAKAREAGQGHVFDNWEELDTDAQKQLIADLGTVNFQLVGKLIHQHIRGAGGDDGARLLEPAETCPLPHRGQPGFASAREIGDAALAAGKLALVMLAGGEGIGPLLESVGGLHVGPVSGKSLFQLHAERVRALQRRYKTSIPWIIVVHPTRLEETTDRFKSNNYFGLNPSSVQLVPQPLLPLIDRRGRFLLASSGRLALRPNGHGGFLHFLLESGQLETLRRAGVEHLFFFQVDNALAKIADPVFVGAHIAAGVEVSSKAIRRLAANEALGVFCRASGATGVVEHSSLPDDEKRRTDDQGQLVFGAANMAEHLFSFSFLDRLASESIQLPFHTVERAVPCLGRGGRLVRPTKPNGVEFRCFLFDALWLARSSRVFVVARESEFSPVKNPGGECSPQTAQRDLSALYTRWLREAGATFRSDGATPSVEISPLYAFDEEELAAKITLPLVVESDLLLSGG